jgi:hypothetical protein
VNPHIKEAEPISPSPVASPIERIELRKIPENLVTGMTQSGKLRRSLSAMLRKPVSAQGIRWRWYHRALTVP